MKILETQYLVGPELDWAVAICEGYTVIGKESPILLCDGRDVPELSYSTDWAQAGPIIEREHIDIRNTFTSGGYRTTDSQDAVQAQIWLPNEAKTFDAKKVITEYGPTALVAAMRCYVNSRLGDTIEVQMS